MNQRTWAKAIVLLAATVGGAYALNADESASKQTPDSTGDVKPCCGKVGKKEGELAGSLICPKYLYATVPSGASTIIRYYYSLRHDAPENCQISMPCSLASAQVLSPGNCGQGTPPNLNCITTQAIKKNAARHPNETHRGQGNVPVMESPYGAEDSPKIEKKNGQPKADEIGNFYAKFLRLGSEEYTYAHIFLYVVRPKRNSEASALPEGVFSIGYECEQPPGNKPLIELTQPVSPVSDTTTVYELNFGAVTTHVVTTQLP